MSLLNFYKLFLKVLKWLGIISAVITVLIMLVIGVTWVNARYINIYPKDIYKKILMLSDQK